MRALLKEIARLREKAHNAVANLEYCTPSATITHAYRRGLNHTPRGEKNANAKYTADVVRRMRAEYRPRVVTVAMLATRYKLTKNQMTAIVFNDWKWLEKADA